MSTGPVTPLPQEPRVHDKRDMCGRRARPPTSWANRSVPRVFAEGSFISGGGARTEGQLPPFRVARRFTLRRCLSSRAIYPLPLASSVPTSREAHSIFRFSFGGASPLFRYTERRTLKSADRSRAQNAQGDSNPEPESDHYFRTSTWASYPNSAAVARLRYKGHG